MPIDCLPPEILAQCFLWYIRIIYHLPDIPAHRLLPKPYAWLIIRHVCRRWRQVALTHPELSSYIWLTSAECVQNLLNSSGSMQLYVCESRTPGSKASAETRSLVLDHFSRIVCGQFRFSRTIPNPMPSPGSTALPPQRGVSIARELQLSFWSIPVAPARMPWQVFTHYNFPYLENFSCTYGSLLPSSRMLGSSLRRLELHCCLHISTLDHLVVLLARLTQLEEFILRDAFRSYKTSLDNMGAVIAPPYTALLPRLQTLQVVDDDCRSAAAVLARLVYPASTSISLRFLQVSKESSHEQMTEIFLSHLGRRKGVSGPFPSLSSASILIQAPTSVELYIWANRHPVHELREKRKTGDSAFFSFCCPDAPMDFITALLARATLAGVHTVLLAEPVVSGLLSWDGVLASLLSVVELGLEYETFDNFDMGADATPFQATFEDKHGAALLPSLKNVRVWEWWHSHSCLPPAEHHPLSTLQLTARALTPRTQPSSSGSGIKEDLEMQSDVLDFHENDSGVCLCGDLIYLDTHPDALTSAPGGSGASRSRVKSWITSRTSRLRKSLKHNP